MLVLLVSEDGVSLGPAAVRRLADLGVTTLAVVRDERTVGLVLQGWAFDPASSAALAADAVAVRCQAVRALHPVMQTAVSPTGWKEEGP
jgi:hypothetical protein